MSSLPPLNHRDHSSSTAAPGVVEPLPIVVTLQPDAMLTALVQRFKDQTRSQVGEQMYLADPPHITVYLAVFPTLDIVLQAWPRLASLCSSIAIELAGWHVFEADALTGNQTLVCQIAAHDKIRLRSLQCKIVEVLAPLRDDAATRQRFVPRSEFLTPAQRECIARFGFPYVGDGWEPHLTIASIKPADWQTAQRALEPQTPQGEYRCDGLELLQLIDGRPVRITPRA